MASEMKRSERGTDMAGGDNVANNDGEPETRRGEDQKSGTVTVTVPNATKITHNFHDFIALRICDRG